jgi:protein O-GlcNAc transferase
LAGLTPFQQGIKLLSEGDAEAARHALLTLWANGGSDAAKAARFIALIDKNQRRFSDAIAILESSLKKFGPEAATLAQLSEFYMTMGHHQKAIDAATQSLQEEPNNAITALNLAIWNSNYATEPLAIKAAFEAWSARYIEPPESAVPLQVEESFDTPNRPLRIGYVSGDFGNHPIRYFIEPYLKLHDASQFEIHAFMTGDEDEISQVLKAWVPHWHNVKALDDSALLSLIRSLGIDILVDLSGHTEASRLEVFVARAAPIQLTWWGFVHTLGIKEIDYRLTDFQTCPSGAEAHYTEALCRMECLTAYAPPVNCENQYPSPWQSNDYVTMISLNHTRKISEATLNCWQSILAQNPNSGLIIVTSETSEVEAGNFFTPRLVEHNFPMDRVSAVPRLSMLEFMNLASVADFALDPFPVSGGVTTLHALWMGLPVLTLTPATPIAMQTYSGNTLRLVDLPDCVTSNTEELISRASQWIQNPTLIDQLRVRARPNLLASPFMDHEGRVRELEACLHAVWQRLINDQPVTDLSSADIFLAGAP